MSTGQIIIGILAFAVVTAVLYVWGLKKSFSQAEELEKILLSKGASRVIKYLKGETILTDDMTGPKEKGWYLVCVDGYPLGFGKLSGGTLKNKYLPGWRWMSS